MSNLEKNRYPKFSGSIQEALSESGMSRVELARALGVDKSTITHYCDGSSFPRSDILESMSKLLNVRPSWLSGFNAPKHPSHLFFENTHLCYPVFNRWRPSANIILSGPDQMVVAKGHASTDVISSMADQLFDDVFIVADDSMHDIGIFEKDIVFLLSNDKVRNMDIVAVIADGQPLLRRYHVLEDGRVQLIPANQTYETLTFSQDELNERVHFIGKAVTVQRMLSKHHS